MISSADGQQLWVTAGNSNALLGFSAARLLSDPKHALLARQAVGASPLGLTLVNHGTRIVVADSDKANLPGAASDLAVVNVQAALARRPALLGYVASGQQPRQFALLPGGGTLLVTNTGSQQLQAVEPHSPAVSAGLPSAGPGMERAGSPGATSCRCWRAVRPAAVRPSSAG